MNACNTQQTMSELEARIVIELARHQLSTLQTAQAMNYHRNTIHYHVRKIKQKTGLDPHDFFDMQKLYPIAKEVTSQICQHYQ